MVKTGDEDPSRAWTRMTNIKQRQPELDFLRAMAIFLVLSAHIVKLNPLPSWAAMPSIIHRPVFFLYNTGWMGVDLFFVLSGFLVSGLLFKEYIRYHAIRPLYFYLRRGFKIYPAFYTLMVFTGLYFFFIVGSLPWKNYMAENLFIQNYIPGMWSHTWTLAVEEHFYLVLPLLLFAFKAHSGRRDDPFYHLPLFTIILASAILGGRILILSTDFPQKYNMAYTFTHFRIDSLMFGVLLSYYYHFHKEKLVSWTARYRYALLITAAISFVLVKVPRSNWWMHSFGFTLIYLAFGLILLVFVCAREGGYGFSFEKMEPLPMIGRYSYSIYLWHLPVQVWIVEVLQKHTGVGGMGWLFIHTVIFCGGSIVLGIGFSKLIEYPMLELRDRLFPSRSGA